MRELFHFDIETIAQYKSFTDFELNDKRGAELFRNKYDWTWTDKYDSVEDAYLDKAGVLSTYGKIICISFGFLDNDNQVSIKSFYGNDEYDIINSFNNLLLKVEKKNFNLAGYKILQFDIPYVLHKMHKYGIKPAEIINPYDKKPWDMRITDIAEDWKQKSLWPIYLDEVAYELGIDSSKDEISGKDVYRIYWENTSNIELIKEYCERDVNVCIEIEKKIYKI
jgi:DNA polymerase elongation subunit (family B)